jgi:hypothetical protein
MKFNDRVTGEIIGAIKIGVSHERAAVAAGVSVRQLHRWVSQGEQDETEGRKTRHARFAREFRKAESDALGQVESNIWQQSQEDWRAGAWLLSKKDRRRYGDDREVAIRHELSQQVVAEFLGFVQKHVSTEAFSEVLHALAAFGDAELDPAQLPVPA